MTGLRSIITEEAMILVQNLWSTPSWKRQKVQNLPLNWVMYTTEFSVKKNNKKSAIKKKKKKKRKHW